MAKRRVSFGIRGPLLLISSHGRKNKHVISYLNESMLWWIRGSVVVVNMEKSERMSSCAQCS